VDKAVKLQFVANFEFNVEFYNSFIRDGVGLHRKLDLFLLLHFYSDPLKTLKGMVEKSLK